MHLSAAALQFQRKKDLKIYLIDAHAAMQSVRLFLPASGPPLRSSLSRLSRCQDADLAADDQEMPGDRRSAFSHAMKCVADTLADLIIASDTDQVGVCLYGTVKHKNTNNFPHIYVLHPLDVPDAAAIKKLRDMADAPDGTVGDLGSLTSTTFKFDYALWVCQTMFAEVKYANTVKSIHILTNCSDPAEGDDRMLRDSVQKGNDLRATGVEMFLYKMRGTKRFLTGNFFKDVMGFQHDKDPDKHDHVMDASTFEHLANGVKSRRHVVRSTGTAPLYIFDEQFFISVTVHTLVQRATKPSAINLEARTNKPIKVETSTVSEDTGEILLENQLGRRYDRYGGAQHIVFQTNELKEMKDFGPSAIRLIGFRDADELKVHHNVKHSSFLQPDEEVVGGSTPVFAALVQKMEAKGVIALASVIPRRSAVPRLCALLPQLLVQGDSGEVIRSMGLHVVYLPYADDMRAPQQNALQPVDRSVVDAAKEVVNQLTVDRFDCRKYHNPSLQKHYKNLQTLALEEEVDEGVEDDVRPNSGHVEKHHALLERFRGTSLGDDWESVQQAAEPKKRKASVSAAALAEADLHGEYDWDEEVASGSIGKLTIPVLRSYLRHHGLSATGKKQELLDRVEAHHNSDRASAGHQRSMTGASSAALGTGAATGGHEQEVDDDGWEVAGNDLPSLDPSSRPTQRQRTHEPTQSNEYTQSQSQRRAAATLTENQTQSQPMSTHGSAHSQTHRLGQRQVQTASTPSAGTLDSGSGSAAVGMDGADSNGGRYTWSWSSSRGWNEYGPADSAALERAYQNVTTSHASKPFARWPCLLTDALLWWVCRGRISTSSPLGISSILTG